MFSLLKDKGYFLLTVTVTICVIILGSIFHLVPVGLLLYYVYRPNIELLVRYITAKNYHDIRTLVMRTFSIRLGVIHRLNQYRGHVIMCNYVHDRFENLFMSLFDNHCYVVAMSGVSKVLQFAKVVPNLLPVKRSGNYNKLLQQVSEITSKGNNVVLYVNKSPYIKVGNYGRIKTGIFKIITECNIPAIPVFFDRIRTNFGLMDTTTPLQLRIGPHVESPEQVCDFFKKCHDELECF